MTSHTILRIDSSMRVENSVSRDLNNQIVEALSARYQQVDVIVRDLRQPPEVITNDWIAGAFTPEGERSYEQRAALTLSDELIAEIQKADTLVIGAPMYNFAVSAALKAWIDQICRAGVTFKYTDKGPVGLLSGKRALVVMASGGVEMGSPADFVTPYLRHVLAFIGITDVEFIAGDRVNVDAEAAMVRAGVDIDTLRSAA